MKKIPITILVSESGRPRLDAIVKGLKARGMSQVACQHELGTVTGLIDKEHIRDIETVAGVEAVEAAREFQLPDPESPVQ